MAGRVDKREIIRNALVALGSEPLAKAARQLFGELGYVSERSLPIATVDAFRRKLDPEEKLTEREIAALDELSSLHLLFQFTDAELAAQRDLFDDGTGVEQTRIHSYLFFAAELPAGQYTRTALSTLVRAINKPLPMPALVLFRHGDSVSIGIIHRRLHKRDQSKDVLEKVTLIKDISCVDPIRAHLEILNDFTRDNLDADFGVSNFVTLHEAWQKRLGSYALSNDFYREIADWYFWAQHQVEDARIRLPQHCDTTQEQSLFLIRLLTRVIFCWFLVEKRLIPSELFRELWLKSHLKGFAPSRDPKKLDTSPAYYHAILQNLFFGTLNMPSEQRGFREKKKEGQRYDKNYGITNLWRYESDFRDAKEWIAICKRIPFLNGGLFDCLDDKSGSKRDNFILDGFSDNPKLTCELPNDLFFGPERTVDLSRDYGEDTKKTARSKKAKVRGLIEILSRYKFTVEENTPLEEEIALDPELLGKVFENLLASYNEDTRTTARKALGAFYTPREIVNYMVDEALKSYLSTQVPRCKGALDDLFSNKATLKEIKPETRDALIAAIGRVKILDPACGSGAFPMGALHRLVDLLQKLDPDNDKWRAFQRLRAVDETEEAFKSGDRESREQRLKEINDTFEFNSSDYGRKLYLIENSIYGVDIQPIATQIAKLRFFISLIVEQTVNLRAQNLGVLPLPNLETRIVAADTLIPIDKPSGSQLLLKDWRLEPLERELERVRHEHFNARNPAAKRRCRERDGVLREQVAEILKDGGMADAAADKLAEWNPYDQNTFAPFFDPEWMFGLPVGKVRLEGKAPITLRGNFAFVNDLAGQKELIGDAPREIDSGFDVVIGNPPYIRIQTLKQTNPKLVGFFKEHYASAAKGNYDIYVVFVEVGLRLLKPDGHLAYICPHKFFNAKYGEPLRNVVAKGQHLRHVVHFGDQLVFPGASIYTCLLFLARGGAAECRFVRVADLDVWKTAFTGEEGRFGAHSITEEEWTFPVGKGRGVFERLQSQSRTLESVTQRIFQGIKTSADKVYIVDELHRSNSKLTVYSPQTEKEHEVEPHLFHPLIKGGDSRSFLLTKTKRLILFPYSKDLGGAVALTPAATLKREFPLTWKYLLENREYLEDREAGRMKHDDWYGFIYPKALDVMPLPKLFTPDLARSASFAFDETGEVFFTGGVAGGYGIIPNDDVEPKWLLAVLNSRAVDFFHHQVATQMRGGWYSYESRFIKGLPIANATDAQVRCMVECVDILLSSRRALRMDGVTQSSRDPLMLVFWERVLNALAYELYFPGQLHEAGIRVYDLVMQLKLSDATKLQDSGRLSHLRDAFETFYEGGHPLRIALDKLQTLDTVRIIEGKA